MLSDRQHLILQAIIENYIHSAEPVGSRTISKRPEISFSSATIRNEMSDLEDLGYLEQPHTSAGRVPSTKGYRYYVDNMIQPDLENSDDLTNWKQLFADRIFYFENAIEQTASVLTQLTNYTAVVLGPEIFEHRLKHLQIISLNETQAVAIIVTQTGRVENKRIDLPSGVSPGEMEKLVNILNTKLHDTPLWKLRQRLYQEVSVELKRHVEQYEEMLTILGKAVDGDATDRLLLKGTTKIMEQPEFQDMEKVKEILELFEHSEQLTPRFDPSRSGLQISIGQEHSLEAMKNCSIVTTSYTFNGKPVGTIGILGPTRMEYGKVIAVLDFIALGLSQMLSTHLNGDEKK
ncbi:heat-inducible transcriptional repressor HrcA [Brevibacillus daliensis]|uniref:heat-inducible transcriptional repressor HrcA n=1 Tax=Brevibacillus daliensis TaxID=2892995 RepID=UPI001E28703C|nr:heat-inducible transcriptional repressor HrcA [Brevibacillus daliensis]